jgi:hypothetical protein
METWHRALGRNIRQKLIPFEQLLKGDYDGQYHHGTAKYDWEKTDKTILNPLQVK